jgi:hypothetical protein
LDYVALEEHAGLEFLGRAINLYALRIQSDRYPVERSAAIYGVISLRQKNAKPAQFGGC